MKIRKIVLENFRCFEKLTVDFSDSFMHAAENGDGRRGSLAALVAPNGKGKTAILDAIRYLLSPFVARFGKMGAPLVRTSDYRQAWTLGKNVVTHEIFYHELRPAAQAPFMRLEVEAEFPGRLGYVRWDIVRARDRSTKTLVGLPDKIGLRELSEASEPYMDCDAAEPHVELPIVAYYNTERAVVRKRPERMRAFRKVFRRSDAYVGALEGGLDYKKLIEWLCAVEDKQMREREALRDFDHFSIEERTIQRAVESLLPGFSNLHTTRNPLNLAVDANVGGVERRCLIDEQLSDGYKIVLALALNLVSRILEANGSLPTATPESLLSCPGVVLIDEIDLHLHPSWQQRIVGDLRNTFPNIQFIVSTHSPQVVSSLENSSVYVVRDGDVRSLKSVLQTRGLDANQLLSDVFGATFAAPSEERAALESYARELERGEGLTEEGDARFARLESYFGKEDPVIDAVRFRRDFLKGELKAHA